MTKLYSKSAKSRGYGISGSDGSIAQGANLETLRYQNQAALRNSHDDDADFFDDMAKSTIGPSGRPRGLGANFAYGLSKGLAHGAKARSTQERKENYDKYAKEMNYLQEVSKASIEQKQWYEKRENARKEMLPQVMSYIDNIDRLDPQSQRIMAQDMLAQYGNAVGEDYKLSSIDGSNPFLMTIQGSKGQQLFDLRSLFAGDEANQQAIAMKMPAYQMKLQEERANKQREFDLKQDKIDVQKFDKGIPGGKYGIREDNTNNPYGSVPLETLKKGGGARPILASLNSEINLAKDIPIVLEQLAEAEDIIEKNPKIGTGWNNWASKGSFSKAVGMDKNLRHAYEKLDKIASRVEETYVKAKGSAITDAERETIRKGLFDSSLQGRSSKYNINSVRKELAIAAERGKFASEQLAKGLAATSESFNNYKKSLEQAAADLPQQDDVWNQIGAAR